MKTKILIIEDSAYKSFTTKQLLEARLRLAVCLIDVASTQELARRTVEYAPDEILCCSQGGAAELLVTMQKRQTNRRNTEITVLNALDMDDDQVEQVRHFVSAYQAATGNSPVAALAAGISAKDKTITSRAA